MKKKKNNNGFIISTMLYSIFGIIVIIIFYILYILANNKLFIITSINELKNGIENENTTSNEKILLNFIVSDQLKNTYTEAKLKDLTSNIGEELYGYNIDNKINYTTYSGDKTYLWTYNSRVVSYTPCTNLSMIYEYRGVLGDWVIVTKETDERYSIDGDNTFPSGISEAKLINVINGKTINLLPANDSELSSIHNITSTCSSTVIDFNSSLACFYTSLDRHVFIRTFGDYLYVVVMPYNGASLYNPHYSDAYDNTRIFYSRIKFDPDNNGDIDPIKSNTTDSNFLFDNDDAIIFDIKRDKKQ